MARKRNKRVRNTITILVIVALLFLGSQIFSVVTFEGDTATFRTGRLPDSGRDSTVRSFDFQFDDYNLHVEL